MNNKTKVIIIDDEKNSVESLLYELKEFEDEIQVIDECLSGNEGIVSINKNKPDLVFLDIEMPGMNGFEMLEKLDTIEFDVVFTTAYDQFALKAFEISAMDYLLKPVNYVDLKKVVDKVKSKLDEPIIQKQLEMLFKLMKNRNPDFPTIALPTVDTLEFIEIVNIVNCESESNYSFVYTDSGEKFCVSKTLKDIQKMLKGHNFVRVHNSHLVNILHVKRYIKGRGGELVLKNGKIIPVSRNKKEDLMKMF